jgi:Ca2+-transporting ATPase
VADEKLIVTAKKAMVAPHTLTAEAVAALLEVRAETGLSAAQAAARLSQTGPNRLPQAPARSPLRVLFSQFKSILILILLAAAALAALVGSTKDAVVILAVVVINSLVGFFQEYRAERSLAALKSMLPSTSRVRRDGQSHDIDANEVVPGDVLLLEAGDRVAADGRLWLAAGLEIDESALTGESQPAAKQAALCVAADAALGDRINLAYMNTLVTRGRAELLVTATGADTEMGRLSQELAVTEEPATPLQVQLDRLGKRLGAIALSLVGLLSFLQFLRGTDLFLIVIDAIALSVAAMPEGLPVVVTVTLALGMHKLALQHAIVKRLASVETLGCTTVICSDKTGTLTLNQMTARTFIYRGQHFEVSGEGYDPQGEITPSSGHATDADVAPLLVAMVACNDSRFDHGRAIGDPMEAALMVLAAKGGILRDDVLRTLPRIAELPFDSAHKFMATFHRDGADIKVFVKGAPDVLLGRCTHWKVGGVEAPFGAPEAAQCDANYHALAARGLRGLLLASRTLPAASFDAAGELSACITDLELLGLVGLVDPPRPEATQAIAECREAGIVVKMITGDHHATALAIAAELGLHGRAVSGADIERMSEEQLAAAIDEVVVFARVTPSHKVKIVRALQAKGHVVAMTGDGVNDAPALKRADIGVAMGISGTAVAKEAATMVLTDDNFATIVLAVRQGRTLYDNILKFIRFQLSTTIGAILTVFFAPLVGLPEPFTALQILWVAIIMDGPPAVSLALDAARPGIMNEPPRHRDEAVLPLQRVLRTVAYGTTMMVGTLTVLHVGINTGSETRALTMAFTTFVLFQFFNVFNARSELRSAFNASFFDNRMLWVSLLSTLALQVVAVHWAPAAALFGTTDLTWTDWGIAIGVASTVLLFEETRKLAIRIWRRGKGT